MNTTKIILSILFYVFIFVGCSTPKNTYVHPSDKEGPLLKLPKEGKVETLFVIGDAGSDAHYEDQQSYLFKHIRKSLEAAGKNSSITFLGDNIYPSGMPKKKSDDREKAEKLIGTQLELVRGLPCETYFIPGNHDWNGMRSGGLKAVKRQEDFIQNYFTDQKVHFYPNKGCGDPVVKKVAKDLYYVFLDSQWWLQNWDHEKNINDGCEVKSKQELFYYLEEIFHKHKNDQLVVFMHHPFFSNGEHGGNFSFKSHFFPLTALSKNLWIPLPVIGSLMPIYRSVTGSKQDIPHPEYQALKKGVLGLVGQNKNVIFAAGHDHSLQYFKDGYTHFVISGAGSKSNFTRGGGDARMVRSGSGYGQMHFYENGSAWLDFYLVDEGHPTGELIYRKEIIKQREGSVEIENNYLAGNELPKTTLLAANSKFKAGPIKKMFLGSQYRNMWTTKVEAPVINLEMAKGGLTPIKKGGGMSSNSLRLENDEGEQYILRSIIKDYRKLFSPDLQNLKAINIMADLNSASHTYGAVVIPTLSEAANIYYTNPKLVYMPHQKGLGYYNDLFNEEFYLLEERPNGDCSNFDNFGNSKDVISYLDLLDKRKETNKIAIDQSWVVRSRIFDMLIHDWDRHDDQWRWAKFDIDGVETYRPIPRDRDQAFYRFNGVIPKFVAAYGVRKFKTFKDDLKDVKWQCFNARYFDRYFMNELEWSDWVKEIEFIQKNVTDEVVENAAKQLPSEVYEEFQGELVHNLKSRRDKMMGVAKKLYDYLALHVSISGSNDDEKFEVNRLENGDVNVQVFSLSKKGKKKKKIYERTFVKDETKEIRLYGLSGKDEFDITGSSNKSILVRVIGGFGNDKLKDESKVGGLGKKTIVYDEPDGIKIKSKGEVKDLTGPSLEENDYNRNDHKYNDTFEIPILGYTPDDKLWLGAGFVSTRHGFRKSPYSSQHNYSFSFSPSSRNALSLSYTGDFIKRVFNYLDVQPSIKLDRPFYINYFGLGNNSIKTTDEGEFNWVRLNRYESHVYLKKSWQNAPYSFYLGPRFLSFQGENVKGRITDDPIYNIEEEQLKRRNYLGGAIGFKTVSVDDLAYPKQGVVTNINASSYKNIAEKESIHFFNAEQIFYLTFGNALPLTVASRTGYGVAKGDLQFYHYPSIGNNNYLRGFRNDRFRGEQIFYQNFDLRLKLLTWNNNYLPMKIGLLGGYDFGKVWYESLNEDNNMHSSVTVGAWFNLLSVIVVQPHFSISDEEKQFSLRFGFNF